MDISEAQVLTQLRIKKARLLMELERVNVAIKAFEEIGEVDELDMLPYMMDEAIENPDELAIATLMYQPKASAEKKIQFVLSKIGKGDAKEITKYLIKIDKDIKDAVALYERITYVASRMFRFGKLEAERSGKRNLYRLNNL
ncbi:MAG: hypothetical protein JWR54_1799 [Mucilaginibacter sp.]|nr:hypothetical protein [Mucilaginibacter sp.]